MEKFLVLAAGKTPSSSSPQKSPTSFIELNDWIFFVQISHNTISHTEQFYLILFIFFPGKEVD